MYPFIITVLKLERDLENEKQEHILRQEGLRKIEPRPRLRRNRLGRSFGRLRRKQACESSCWSVGTD
jgi:hypothetical protein